MLDNLNSSQDLLIKAAFGLGAYFIIRNIPSIITAIYLNSEAKRHNQKRLVWAFMGYAFPIITPIVFFFFIKHTEKSIISMERKGISKKSIISFVISLLIIFVSFILGLTSSAMVIGSLVKSQMTGEHLVTFYDKMGNEYDELDITIDMYDRDGNRYVRENKGLFEVVYIDEKGNELDADKCFIDSDGWMFYDENGTLKIEEDYDWYVCARYQDADGNKYFQLGEADFEIEPSGEILASFGKMSEELDFDIQ